MFDLTIFIVFVLVYLGMILGGLPYLALDRTGVALLGAIALVAFGKVTPEAAWDAVDIPTITLLFGLMVVSAQLRLGGFYSAVTRRLAKTPMIAPALLGLLIAVAGGLSALLVNDIICLAMAPVLIDGCARRGFNSVPFLLGLACAANVGSAATLIGNPQNMLIGQTLGLSFAGYLGEAAAPTVAGLILTWFVIAVLYRGKWREGVVSPVTVVPEPEPTALNPWQTGKGLVILALLVTGFLAGRWPREVLALTAAGLLLASRRMATRRILGLVDWHLLVLFMGLFIVNHALKASGMLGGVIGELRSAGIDPAHPAWLFGVTPVLSNLVSNVPAVMLLLPVATHPLAGPILALSSTLAGNLFIVGSIANIIVVEQAARQGVVVGWKEHARCGVPVTVLTLAAAAVWLMWK
ncbi:anion transporter [bacterium]|nr:anion transporter [bacterium]